MGRSRKTAKPTKRYRPDTWKTPSATGYTKNTREDDHWQTQAEHQHYWTLVAEEIRTFNQGVTGTCSHK